MSTELDEKITRFTGFLAQDPSNANIACELMDLYLQAGKHQEAVTFYEKNNDAFANHAEFLFKVSTSLLAVGDFETAITCLKQIKMLGVTELGVEFNLAFAYFYQREFQNADAAIEAILPQWQEHPPIVILAARIFHFTEKYTAAIDHLKEYLKRHQEDAEAWGLLALIALDSDNDSPEEQKQYADKALAINPQQMEALLTLAQLSIGLQDIAGAEQFSQQAVSAHPKSGRAWSYKGQSDMLSLDFVIAEESLDKAVKYMPDHVGTWHALAWCALLRNKVDKAQACFDSAIELDRNFAESHGGIALMFHLKGNLDEAKLSVRRALGLDKNCFTARYVQALILEQEGKTEEAKQIIKAIMDSDIGGQAQMFIQLLQQNTDLKPRLH